MDVWHGSSINVKTGMKKTENMKKLCMILVLGVFSLAGSYNLFHNPVPDWGELVTSSIYSISLKEIRSPWILLRLSLLLTFLLSGLLFAKMLKKRLALRFEMFTYKGSYFIITGAVLVIALAICAKVYNKIRWKIVCNDYDADCSCEDAKCGGYLSNDLHMQNNTFARLTQCGAFIADTLAVFSVLDLTLQDDSVYHISSSFNVSGFWEKHRSKILWGGFALLMILGIPSIVFSSGAFLAYQQKFSLGHRSNIGRMVVAGILFVVDLCIVTQDLDLSTFWELSGSDAAWYEYCLWRLLHQLYHGLCINDIGPQLPLYTWVVQTYWLWPVLFGEEPQNLQSPTPGRILASKL